jgi:hypothetical protein
MHAANYLFTRRAGLHLAGWRPTRPRFRRSARLHNFDGGEYLAGGLDGHRFTPSPCSGDPMTMTAHDDVAARDGSAALYIPSSRANDYALALGS